jgi:hypothetical protein
MKTGATFRKLRSLQKESEHLRKRLGVSNTGEVIFQAPKSLWSEADIVVEADGLGGARLLVVEGNYPIDYMIKLDRKFDNEDAACDAAQKLDETPTP